MTLHHLHLVFARRADGPPPRFLRLIEREAHARDLVFFHCQNHEQAEVLRGALGDGSLLVDCLVDYMGRSFRHDYELGCAVKAAGGLVIDDPDRVRAFGNKLTMHQELERTGVELPRTLLWRAWQPSRDLTIVERELLGPQIVCKPSGGSGAGGVCLDLDGSRAALDAARDYDPDDDFLLQEYITPLRLGGRAAWFRVYNCFGRVFACFWDPASHATTLMTPAEIAAYRLHELARISNITARISGYTWFSSEIALTERAGRRIFLPIDYLNNKCFMLTQSEVGAHGLPDALAETVAREIAEQTAQHARQRSAAPRRW